MRQKNAGQKTMQFLVQKTLTRILKKKPDLLMFCNARRGQNLDTNLVSALARRAGKLVQIQCCSIRARLYVSIVCVVQRVATHLRWIVAMRILLSKHVSACGCTCAKNYC